MSEKTVGSAPGDPEKSQGFAGAFLILQVLLYCTTHLTLSGTPEWNEWSDQSLWVALILGFLGVPVVARRNWSSACILGTAIISAIVIWPCLFSEWNEAGARILAFIVLVGGVWGFLWSGLELSQRKDVSVFLACMLLGGIAVGIDAVYLKSVSLLSALMVLLVMIRLATWIFRKRPLEASVLPVLYFFVGSIGLTLVLTNWLHIVPEQRPTTIAYLAVVALPQCAWISEVPGLAKRQPTLRIGIQILVAGSILAVAFFPLFQTWRRGEFDFLIP